MSETEDISELDGGQPPAECRESRLRMLRTHRLPEGLAFRYFSDEFTAPNFPEVEQAAVDHVRACPSCRSWTRRVVPEDVFRRAERRKHYCCMWMFHACDGADQRIARFEWVMERDGESFWSIEGKWGPAQFCPWCGKALPSGPFVQQ